MKNHSSAVSFFVVFTIFLWVSTTVYGAPLPSAITIVEGGKSLATIILADNASQQVKSAATVLSQYIKESSGVNVPIAEKPASSTTVQIHVGRSNYVDKHKSGLQGMNNGDGFTIYFPDNRNIVIVGVTDWGTEFGVYEFLERYLGIRWLLPTKAGDYVPSSSRIDVPIQTVKQLPVFLYRNLSGLPVWQQNVWARMNRMHDTGWQFSHNLANLFPSEKYAKSHPEFYPIIKGKRFIPPAGEKMRWQPCFSASGIVDEAVKNIIEYFEKSPDKTSYSLGINDLDGFCECEQCLVKDGSKKNFLGYPDHSNSYYQWSNEVVTRVLKRFPDKWFGCIAYSSVAQPPANFRLNPRIIPFLTQDRMKWIDKDIEIAGKNMTELWGAAATRLGWYDYMYGTPYMVPRVYFNKMGEYIRYASYHKVQAIYAEAYPNWGEGPKMYVALKLMWNPDADVQKLLNEWYEAAVGKDAAPDLAAYYILWENFWTDRILGNKWFSIYRDILPFHMSGYLESVTLIDIAKSRQLLESVLSKTKTKEQKARAEILFKSFEFYEASTLSFLSKGVSTKKTDYEKMSKKRVQLLNEFKADPVLQHPLKFDAYKQLVW